MDPLVYISVLNWRNPEDTAACVASLHDLDYPNKRIIVVNNGDQRTLLPAIDTFKDQVTIVHNGGNRGYCGGNNQVVARALEDRAAYVWFFNSDAVAEPRCLSRLVEAAERHPEVGLLSPVIYSQQDRRRVWNAGGWYDVGQTGWGWFDDPDRAGRIAAAHPDAFMLAGTALLVRTAAARAMGVLDERLFAYFEDVDYSIRAQRANLARSLVTDGSVYHSHGLTDLPSRHACYYTSRNEVLLWRKHASVFSAARVRYWALRRTRRAVLRYAEHPALQEACVSGWWHGQTGVTGEWNPTHQVPRPVRAVLGC